jgi:N utilization substance protein B
LSRTTARKHAFFLIYQIPFHSRFDPEEALELYLSSTEGISEEDKRFISKELSGFLAASGMIDEMISKASVNWDFTRLGSIDKALLRLATYEIFNNPDIPSHVAINEAVELSKRYGADDSPKFINGILRTISLEAEADGKKDKGLDSLATEQIHQGDA